MNLILRLRDILFYGGLHKEGYDSLIPALREENRELLTDASALAMGVFAALSVVSTMTAGVANMNGVLYITTALAMFALHLLVVSLGTGHPHTIGLFIYIFRLILYAFAIRVSLMHPEFPAVTVIVFLMMVPMVFLGRPGGMVVLTVIVATVTIVCIRQVKELNIAQDDTWNIVSFGFVGLVANVLIMKIRLKSLYQAKRIEYLSVTDLLTGVRNRNCYQNDLPGYAEICRDNLVCVYADVNGLHELNNRAGHEAGDRMLIDVAAEMIKHFGAERVYRIGGDEFVAFRTDAPLEETQALLDEMRHVFAEEGYYVSFGAAEAARDGLDIAALLRQAEAAMYDEKRRYYEQSGYDRRRSRSGPEDRDRS